MKRLTLIVCTAVAATAAASASATTTKPVCHWTHHKAAAVNVYVQVCKTAPKHKHPVASRWTSAGPSNSAAPRIG